MRDDVIEPESHQALRREIAERIQADRGILDELRREVRPLLNDTRRIQPRSTTSISLVGTDGGNNSIQFDPFLVQLVRVVDSSNNEYCLQAITPTTNVDALARLQFDASGAPSTPLGEMMSDLGMRSLQALSHMIRSNDGDRPTSPSWVQVYRELVEWATLYSILKNKDFGTDTLIVFDGLLRSKVFARDNFKRYLEFAQAAIDRQWCENRRRVYLVGVAKHSKVLARYRLAMALENIMTTAYPAYVEVPRDLEERAYVWSEYARGDDRELGGGEINKFVGGKMFLVKFGQGTRDPIWPIDIFLPQTRDAKRSSASCCLTRLMDFLYRSIHVVYRRRTRTPPSSISTSTYSKTRFSRAFARYLRTMQPHWTHFAYRIWMSRNVGMGRGRGH